MIERPATDPPSPRRRRRLVAALTGRAGLRALLAAVIVVVALLFPIFTTTAIFEVAAVALIVVGLHGAWLAARARPVRTFELARDLVVATAGGAILWLRLTDRGGIVVAALAILLAIRGLLGMGAVARDPDRRSSVWPWIPGAAQVVVGGLLWVVPASLAAISLAIAMFWIVAGALNLQRALNDPDADPTTLTETGTAILDFLRTQDVGTETRAEVERGLFFEDPLDSHGVTATLSRARLWRFVALMSFSTAIATFGISSDSTAVVIGAMLVAPLMTPILGVSASIVSGWSGRLARSLAVVGLGIVIAVALSYLLSRYVGGFLVVERNTQIASRISPTLVDLAIAVAAGAAGAYANARRDVADSLPGVAIAVALVPPLSVVGTVLQEGEFGMAFGAFLLFATNLVGIIVAAAITFFLLGLLPWTELASQVSTIGRNFATAAVALVIIAIPLALSGEALLTSATSQARIDEIVEGITAETAYQIVDIQVSGSRVEVLATGPPEDGDLDVAALGDSLRDALGRDFTLVVRLVPEQVFELEVTSAG